MRFHLRPDTKLRKRLITMPKLLLRLKGTEINHPKKNKFYTEQNDSVFNRVKQICFQQVLFPSLL